MDFKIINCNYVDIWRWLELRKSTLICGINFIRFLNKNNKIGWWTLENERII